MTNVLEQNEVTTAPRRNLITAKTLSYIVLALAIAVSGYLSYEKLTPGAAVCIAGGAFDCGTVLNSVYSEFLGIPIAALGLATNLVVLSILLLENRIGFLREFATPLVFGILLFAF
ncbi:MAG: vitamin K epoxide reductase family protein, partial [Chloroflexota bacterium]